ncbi:MAG TPA: transglycosylase domain-containing protein [Acidimicrobiales bacterium]|nr:transglycosylase domain-containing protein [Acidimicrobiales bacterium]
MSGTLLVLICCAVIIVPTVVLVLRFGLLSPPRSSPGEWSGPWWWSSGGGRPSSGRGRAWFTGRRGWTTTIVIMAVVSVLMPVLVATVLYNSVISASQSGSLPTARTSVGAPITQVFDANGAPIASFQQFTINIPVTSSDIPAFMKNAAVAAEDRRFYQHKGVDTRGILRALWADLNGGGYVQGGSTIDQQYVRLVYGSNVKSIHRKLREAILAGRLDLRMTKDQILTGYLTRAYFGGGAYGVGAAAQLYFHKSVKDLTLSESALLAGILPAPSAYNPRADPVGAEQRRQDVLTKMADQGLITADQETAAKGQPLLLLPSDPPVASDVTLVYPPSTQQTPYPWFVDYVKRYLIARFGEDRVLRGGLRVETSLDPRLQGEADAAVAATLNGTVDPVDMAMVVVDPNTGLVKAMVGGRDFTASQVNAALGSCPPTSQPAPANQPICIDGGGSGRQPGSAFKPFTLAKAFEESIDPNTYFSGPSTYTYPLGTCLGANCTVHNVESGGYGSISLRDATAYSVNTVFAQLIEKVGVVQTAELAHRLGLTMINPKGRTTNGFYGPSLTLGSADVSPLDMAAAYGVFAARGMQFSATPVLRVVAADGTVLEDNTARAGQRVMAQSVADQVNDVLKGVVAKGTGTAANIGRPDGTAGKTGTTESFSDAWFVGYTPQLVASVWMGDSNGRHPLVNIKGVAQVFGGTLPAQTWHDFMVKALAGVPVQNFAPPAPPTCVPSTPTTSFTTGSSDSTTTTSTTTTTTIVPTSDTTDNTGSTSTAVTFPTPSTILVPCPTVPPRTVPTSSTATATTTTLPFFTGPTTPALTVPTPTATAPTSSVP